jgi:hypothetical protein
MIRGRRDYGRVTSVQPCAQIWSVSDGAKRQIRAVLEFEAVFAGNHHPGVAIAQFDLANGTASRVDLVENIGTAPILSKRQNKGRRTLYDEDSPC